jgi:excisionase family DNA binding protein
MMSNETQLLKGHEVAKVLNVSRATAYIWMARGILPVFRVPGSRSIRVPRLALDKFIEARTQQPEADA